MLPTKEEAERILEEAEICNPGLWGNHSRIVAECAKKLAIVCDDLDGEKSYILGLLHDIGRKFGIKHLGHVYDGYKYMMKLGYDEVARICLTHSFCNQKINCYIGNFDIAELEQKELETVLNSLTYDDYDRLIQLCDCLASGEGIMDIEERMKDVKRRYGSYPPEKWNKNLELKAYFENKAGNDIYVLMRKTDK